ncbi:MAG: helix-turn-helix domain-containing protein [Vallitalea sp.]|jgi:DNA-binding IclR family transcriptional regulator|nr:helix-turn-helix domain-containing protein [Vallitalea sp.]
MGKKIYIQSIGRALNILEYISNNGNKCRIQDISNDLDLNNSTVHSIVSTLEQHGYIQRDSQSPKYSLGISTLKLCLSYTKDIINNGKIHDILSKITDVFNETTYFTIRVSDYYFYVDSISPNRTIKAKKVIGEFEDINSISAIGKVYRNFDIKNDILYEFDIEEIEEGMNCIAFPLIKNNGLIGVVGVNGPSGRCTKEKFIEKYNKTLQIINLLNIDL